MADWCIIESATGDWVQGPMRAQPSSLKPGTQALAVDPAWPDAKDYHPSTKSFVAKAALPVSMLRVSKAADEARASIVLANDAALTVNAAADTRYRVILFVPFNASLATTGFKFALTGPAGAALMLNDGGGPATKAIALGGVKTITGSAGLYAPYFLGVLAVGSTGGAVTLQWAANGIGSATLKAGAHLELVRLA